GSPGYTIEKRCRHSDGRWVWVRVTSSLAIADDRGGPYRIAVVEDISEQKLASERGRGDEAKYRAIIDTAVDAIAVIDETGLIQPFNGAAERLFGYAAGEVLGKNVSLLMPEPDHARHDGYLESYRLTGHAKIIGIG